MAKYLDNDGLLYLWGKIKGIIPTKTSQLTNDSGYLTQHQDISGKLDKTGDAKDTTATFTAATTRTNISTGEKLSVIMGKIAKYFADLKTVAFTGAYNDLTGKPAIPSKVTDLTNDAGYITTVPGEYVTDTELTGKGYQTANQVEGAITNKGYQTAGQVEAIVTGKGYQTATDVNNAIAGQLTNVYEYKGSVASYSALPAGASKGDVYNVESDGMNYAWNGSAWDALGASFTIDSITNAEIDAIVS